MKAHLCKMTIMGMVLFFTMEMAACGGNGDDTTATFSVHSGYRDEEIKKGWYWYEVEKELEEEKEGTEELPPVIEIPQDPWNMPVEEFSRLLEEVRNTAIQNPTIENVKKYIELQDIARRKAVAFANVYTLVMQMHPEFTTAGQYPVANPGILALTGMRRDEIEGVIQASREDFALVYFFRPDCRFCTVQNNILRYFVDKYHWELKHVNIYDEPESAVRFNVTTVPYILVVYRDTGEYMPVGVGVVALSTLERNLFRAIRYLKGEISPSQFTLYDYAVGGAGDPEVKRILEEELLKMKRESSQ